MSAVLNLAPARAYLEAMRLDLDLLTTETDIRLGIAALAERFDLTDDEAALVLHALMTEVTA